MAAPPVIPGFPFFTMDPLARLTALAAHLTPGPCDDDVEVDVEVGVTALRAAARVATGIAPR